MEREYRKRLEKIGFWRGVATVSALWAIMVVIQLVVPQQLPVGTVLGVIESLFPPGLCVLSLVRIEKLAKEMKKLAEEEGWDGSENEGWID